MRKRVLTLSLVLAFVLGITAQATGPARVPSRNLSLSFQGTTAMCSAAVRSDKATDKVSITVRLCNNGAVLKTWRASGTQVVRWSATAPVVRGQTYQLTMSTTINGIQCQYDNRSGTCP